MRVPLSWLREYVDVDLTPERLAERLTLLGMEVKGLERWGADWRSVVVGELVTVDKHPRADRLSLTTVRVGGDEVLQIVCGATNIAPGQRVPVALPGAVLPGGRRIERAEKMGVTSNGMLCSGDELELTTDADGILILPPETPLGADLSELYGDMVLDVDVKPNRGDALCIVGLAREVAAATGATLRWPEIALAESGTPVGERLSVLVEDPALCSRFVGRIVTGVTVGPSPDRVQMRLRAAGMRPVSNVVDASNYVMLELGKPTHAFDASVIREGRLVVRTARPGERLETLDHVERELDGETLLIADPSGPLAIAGVLGGAASEVGEATRDVVIESAIFDPVAIRRTGQRYALRSEASLRFEKGQEVRLARIGADRVAGLVAAWADGTVAPGRVDTAPDEPAETTFAFRPARVDHLLGTGLGGPEQARLLARVGVATALADGPQTIPVALPPTARSVTAEAADSLVATIPTWRRDLGIETDIAEEVARILGYEEIPPRTPETPMPGHRRSPLEIRDLIRDTLAGAGVSEVVTPALVSPADVDRFGPIVVAPIPGEVEAGGRPILVTNPLSSQHAVLRQSLFGSLLEVVVNDLRRGHRDVALFEVGKGYGRDGTDVREWWRLGFVLTGATAPVAWDRVARSADLDDAKGVVELLCRRLGAVPPAYRPLSDSAILHPGRAALADSAAKLSGVIGELHPTLAEALELGPERVILGEVSIQGLTMGSAPIARVSPIPRYPAVERDLAVIVAETTPAATVDAVIRAAAGPLLARTRLFDVYRGAPLGDGEKSLAERLVFQAPDRTLTDPEIDAAMTSIVESLAAELGARRRS